MCSGGVQGAHVLTEEQLIVLGFLVAAFAVGWLARALIGRRDRRGRDATRPEVSREHLEQAVEATRKELDRAIRSHVAAVALSVRARDGATPEPAAAAPAPEAPRAAPVPAEAPEPRPVPATPGRPDPLAEEVSAALQDDAANECMLSAVAADRGADLSERELDLTDWGFAYGVAWARAHTRGSNSARDAVAREALEAADAVFRAYAAEAAWARPEENGRSGQPRPGDKR
jgi:hypothetical protein